MAIEFFPLQYEEMPTEQIDPPAEPVKHPEVVVDADIDKAINDWISEGNPNCQD